MHEHVWVLWLGASAVAAGCYHAFRCSLSCAPSRPCFWSPRCPLGAGVGPAAAGGGGANCARADARIRLRAVAGPHAGGPSPARSHLDGRVGRWGRQGLAGSCYWWAPWPACGALLATQYTQHGRLQQQLLSQGSSRSHHSPPALLSLSLSFHNRPPSRLHQSASPASHHAPLPQCFQGDGAAASDAPRAHFPADGPGDTGEWCLGVRGRGRGEGGVCVQGSVGRRGADGRQARQNHGLH